MFLRVNWSPSCSCFVMIISDTAKSQNTAEDMTVYTALYSAANLSVKFHMNPVSNYTVHWSMDSSNSLKNSNVNNAVKGNNVKTTFFISNVTKKHLGNYTVRVINSAIASKHNEAIFGVTLKLLGEKSYVMLCLRLKNLQSSFTNLHSIEKNIISKKL